MTWAAIELVSWFLAAVVAAFIANAVITATIRVLHGRAMQLAWSRHALEKYDEIIDPLLEDPALPSSVEEFLTEFDRGVMHPRAARSVAKTIFNNPVWIHEVENEDEPQVLKDMAEVEKHRPDLARDFALAIKFGFEATMLRWPISATALGFLMLNLQRDPVTPGRALACGAAKNENGDKHHMNGAVPHAA